MLRSIPPALGGGAPDLPVVPPFVLAILGTFLSPILTWFSHQVYRAVLTRCATHPLVRLAQCYDVAPVVAACQPSYHAPGAKGAPPTYTVEQLVRAEFVRAWAESCSDPELEWLLAANLIARWFVDLPLLGATGRFDVIDHRTYMRHPAGNCLDGSACDCARDLAAHRDNAALDMRVQALPTRALVARQRLRDSDLDLALRHDPVRNLQHTAHVLGGVLGPRPAHRRRRVATQQDDASADRHVDRAIVKPANHRIVS